MRKMKKSPYRIVPSTHETLGACWVLKEKETVLGTFISKQHAEKRQAELESRAFESMVLKSTVRQELKVLED